MAAEIERRIQLSADHVDRLTQLAERHQLSEDRVIEKALDILFSLAEVFDNTKDRQGWTILSEDSLRAVWDNDQDARYDNWRELYGVPAR